MVSTTRVPNTAAVLEYRWAPRIAARCGSIDRTICCFSSKLRLEGETACRFALMLLGRRIVGRGCDGMGGIVWLSADHQLPGDVGFFVRRRPAGALVRPATTLFRKPYVDGPLLARAGA